MLAPENPLQRSIRRTGPVIGGFHGREMSSPLPRHLAGFAVSSCRAIPKTVSSASLYRSVAPPAADSADRG
jgi:hypothetical protein